MEKDVSSSSKNISLKFNSDLLNRPFSSRIIDRDNLVTNSFYTHSENKFNNSLYNNTEFHNTSKIYNHSQSISLTNKDFNEIDEKNLSFQSETYRNENAKSRKPFDKLSFTTSSLKNETDSSKKAMEDTDLSIKKTTNEEFNNSLISQYMDETNKTNLTEDEKIFIKSRSQLLSIETFEKAKLYNIQSDSDSIPFWIKFFSEIENSSLNSKSSYFKVRDKDRYVANLIDMVKRDAELYETTIKHEMVRKEVKNNIKSLLITEIEQPLSNSGINKNNENSKEEEKLINVEEYLEYGETRQLNTNSNLVQNPKTNNNEDKINGKLSQILSLYDQLEEKENKISRHTIFNKITHQPNERKQSNSKKNNFNLNLRNGSSRSTLDHTSSKSIEINSELEYKLIENLKFNDEDYDGENYLDEFKEMNYEDVDFGCFRQESLKRLLDIDRRLNEINPNCYKNSINTHLKSIAIDFKKDKNQRLKEIDEKLASNKSKKVINQTKSKPTIFDIKLENNEKVKYKDYMREEKIKKEKQNRLESIDDKLKLVNNCQIDEEKREKLLREIKELRENMDDILVPDDNDDTLDKKFEEIEERQKLKDYSIKKCEENLKHTQMMHIEKLTQWKKELEKPYYELMSVIDEEYRENKIMIERAEEIEKNLEKTEFTYNQIKEKFVKIKQEEDKYNNMWNEADEIFKQYDWGEDISKFDLAENDRETVMNNDNDDNYVKI